VVEKAKERTEVAKRKENEKEVNSETEKSKIEHKENHEEFERQQRTLFEFSK